MNPHSSFRILLVLTVGSAHAAMSSAAIPVFREISSAAGVSFDHETGFDGRYLFPEIVGGGCAIADFDGDGRNDVFFVNGGALDPPGDAWHGLFRNTGGGRFEDVSSRAGLRAIAYGQGCAVADYDADGDLDLYVTCVGRDQLFRNDGDGRFTDVAAAAGLDDAGWTTSAEFADLDLDGDLDLFVTSYCLWSVGGQVPCRSTKGDPDYCNPSAFPPAPDVYYRNRGDGTFENATREAGLSSAYGHGLGVLVRDVDADGDPDVYVANDGDANLLWLNDGAGAFREEGLLSGTAFDDAGMAEASMGTTSADLDGDGRWEIFLTHMSRETNTLYVNEGGGVFRDATDEWGLGAPSMPATGFGTRFFDVDLDGDDDLFVANGAVIKDDASGRDDWPYAQRDQLYLNEGGRFRVMAESETPWLDPPGVGRGAAFADLDEDGDVDVVVAQAGGSPRVYRNDTERGADWIGVRLVQGGANREGIGAWIDVSTRERRVRRWVTRGESYASASEARVVAGGMRGPIEIGVHWPDGDEETWVITEGARDVDLVRGSGRPRSLDAVRTREPVRAAPEFAALRDPAAASLDTLGIPPLPALDGVDEGVAARLRASHADVEARPEDASAWRAYGISLFADAAAEGPAAAALWRVIAADSSDARVAYLLGVIAARSGDEATARSWWTRVVSLEPSYVPARLRIARAELDRGNVIAAERVYRALVTEEVPVGDAWIGLARVHRARGAWDEAAACAARAVELAPRSREAHYEAGLAARGRGDLDAARAAFSRAESLPEMDSHDPWLAELAVGRGGDALLLTDANRLRLAGDYAGAEAVLREYVARRPLDPIGWANLAAALRDSNRPEGALEAAERALELDDSRAEVWALRGVLTAPRDAGAAIGFLEKAVALRPELAPAWLDLARIHQGRREWERALACFDRVVALEPANPDAWVGRAEVRLARGEPEQAAVDLAEALVVDPRHPAAHFRSGGLALRDGNARAARTHFEAAVRARPGWPDAYFGLALAHRAADSTSAAREALERAIELAPDHPRYREVLRELAAPPKAP